MLGRVRKSLRAVFDHGGVMELWKVYLFLFFSFFFSFYRYFFIQGSLTYCLGGLVRNLPRITRELDPQDPDHGRVDGKTSKPTNKKGVFSGTVEMLSGFQSEYSDVLPRLFQTVILQPLELITVRMVTEDTPQYSTTWETIKSLVQSKLGIGGLFTGVRVSILTALMPYSGWYLGGFAQFLKTRCMLDGAGFGESLEEKKNRR